MKTYLDGLREAANIAQGILDGLAKDAASRRIDSADRYGITIEMQAVKTVVRALNQKVNAEQSTIGEPHRLEFDTWVDPAREEDEPAF